VSPSALIVGHAGQDGVLLKEFLKTKGYTVLGLGRGDLDITSFELVRTYLAQYRPQEIYFLAAHHHSSEDLQNAELNESTFMSVNYTSAANFLKAIAELKLISRFFYASSSHIFSTKNDTPQNENSLVEAEGLYAKSKILAMEECRRYREQKSVFASVGILYNHESYLRKNNFVSKKITSFVADLCNGVEGVLELVDLDAVVDWGDAEDFVEAF
jgi:GDPmannose 4,6-dehydratase